MEGTLHPLGGAVTGLLTAVSSVLAALPGAVSLVEATLRALHRREGMDAQGAAMRAEAATSRIKVAQAMRKSSR